MRYLLRPHQNEHKRCLLASAIQGQMLLRDVFRDILRAHQSKMINPYFVGRVQTIRVCLCSTVSSGLKQEEKPEQKLHFLLTLRQNSQSFPRQPHHLIIFSLKWRHRGSSSHIYIWGEVAATGTLRLPPSLISLLISHSSNQWE